MPVGAWELEFGCQTVADPNRVAAYVANSQNPAYCVDGVNALAPVAPAWSTLRVNCGCDALNWTADAPGATPVPIEPYTTPALDGAPWYDSNVPESAHFYGFMVEQIVQGQNAQVTRAVNDRVTSFGGASLGSLRRKGRQMQIVLLAFGAYETAMDYGFRWLGDLLTSDFCTLCDMTIRTACPILDESPTYDQWDTGRWTFKNVGVIEGPAYAESPNPATTCNVRRIVFTVVASVPYGYKCPVEVISNESWITEMPPCPPEAWICGDAASTCTNVTSDYLIGEDAIVVEVKAGKFDISGLTVKITPDPYGWVCDPASAPAQYNPPDPCDTISIPLLPAGYKLRYDSTDQTITVTMPGGMTYDGTYFLDTTTGTAPSFPAIRSGQYCVCVSSIRSTWRGDTESTVSVWTVHRELTV